MIQIRTRLMIAVIFIALTGSFAHASPEYDRVYQLETLGWLKPADNVDGIFAEYLDEIFTDYFKKQSRFLVKSLSGLDSVLGHSSMSYNQLIQSKDLLKKVAQKFKVEGLIRSHVYKEGDTYRIELEWVYAPRGDILAQHEFRYVDPKKDAGLKGSDLSMAVERGLDELIAKLPFLGQVTGVDGENITVNVGRNQRIQPKQIFVIYTLKNVKRHPILNTIEEWSWEPVAKAQVQQVEESISFAKVIETEVNHSVIRYEKVREILPAPPENPLHPTSTLNEQNHPPRESQRPRIGWLAANVGIGSYSREVGLSQAAGSGGRGGGGLLENVAIESHLWLNTRWLAEISFSESFYKYAPTDLSNGSKLSTSYSGTASQIRLAAGYAFFPSKTVFDPTAWVHFGYRTTSYSLSTQATDFVASSKVGGIFVGLGGEVPVNQDLTAQLGLDLGILRSAASEQLQNQLSVGDPSGSSDLMFSFGAAYHLQSEFFLRLILKVNSQSMDFTDGSSLSQKTFSVSPSIMYYF